MAYVVADPCVKCKYTDCVAVCPVDCFYEGKNSLAINPDECIDCGACEPECPTTAIFEESELPAKWAVYKDINAVVTGVKKPGEIDSGSWPDALKAQFVQELRTFEEERHMTYITSVEEVFIEQGLAKGMAKGLVQGLIEGIAGMLDLKFGDPAFQGLWVSHAWCRRPCR